MFTEFISFGRAGHFSIKTAGKPLAKCGEVGSTIKRLLDPRPNAIRVGFREAVLGRCLHSNLSIG
jgi:hypothetical protein